MRELRSSLDTKVVSKQRVKLIVNLDELGSMGIMFLARSYDINSTGDISLTDMRIVTRREALFAGAIVPVVGTIASDASKLAIEAYIFQQYAQRQNKTLGEVLGEVIPMVCRAGFHKVEFNDGFFEPEVRNETLALVRSSGLQLPSVYTSGVLHDPALAVKTMADSLEIAKMCRPFGCSGLVFNVDPKGYDADHKLIEKTDAELTTQAEQMNRMGRQLRDNGFELRIHNHTPEMTNGAREWRHLLAHTEPRDVAFCVDLNWVSVGGQDPLGLLKEAGNRVREIHVRNERNHVWLEDLEDGDLDYHAIASYLQRAKLEPLIVVELAYMKKTQITRPLEKDLDLSRAYAEKIFNVKG